MTTRFEVLDHLDRCVLAEAAECLNGARESGVLTVEDHRMMDQVMAILVSFHAHVRRTVG